MSHPDPMHDVDNELPEDIYFHHNDVEDDHYKENVVNPTMDRIEEERRESLESQSD